MPLVTVEINQYFVLRFQLVGHSLGLSLEYKHTCNVCCRWFDEQHLAIRIHRCHIIHLPRWLSLCSVSCLDYTSDAFIVLLLFWDDLFGVVILYLDSNLVLWLITTQGSHHAVALHCFLECSSKTSPSSSLVMKEKTSLNCMCFILLLLLAQTKPSRYIRATCALFCSSREAPCVWWRTLETINTSEGFSVFYLEPCFLCTLWYFSCYTCYVHRCSFPTELMWSCWGFFFPRLHAFLSLIGNNW